MKKLISAFAGLSLFSAMVNAEEEATPFILPQAFAQHISPNGKLVVAQDLVGNAIIYFVGSEHADFYEGFYPGNGNCISNYGLLVGQAMLEIQGAVMQDGFSYVPSTLLNYGASSLDAITPEGYRACGWITNPSGNWPMQVPFYCDITDNGDFSAPHLLPYPEKDFFGDTPQFCNAISISDDGKTIAGVVTDGTGVYSYPIVYKEDENGNWSYLLPSAPLFNPDNLPLPSYPEDNVPPQPQIYDFMSADKRAEWLDDLQIYEETNDPEMNPWNHISYYITDEEYELYEKAIVEFNAAVWDYYDAIDEYWETMTKMASKEMFLPNIALNPQGTLLMIDLIVPNDDNYGLESNIYVPYLFDLETNEIAEIETLVDNLLPIQILADGTISAVTAPGNISQFQGYVKLPGENDFIRFDEYISRFYPSLLPWVEENLEIEEIVGNDPETGDYIWEKFVVSGVLSFSEDRSVMAGGIPIDSMLSYIITSTEEGGVSANFNSSSEVYNVYSLSGIKILTTKEESEVSKLPAGYYIINGKKVLIK